MVAATIAIAAVGCGVGAVLGAFESPVGHLAFDHAGVARGRREQVALDLSQGPGQCAGEP